MARARDCLRQRIRTSSSRKPVRSQRLDSASLSQMFGAPPCSGGASYSQCPEEALPLARLRSASRRALLIADVGHAARSGREKELRLQYAEVDEVHEGVAVQVGVGIVGEE